MFLEIHKQVFFAHYLIKNGWTFFSIFKRYKFPSHELFEKYNTNSLMILVMYIILSGFNVNSIINMYFDYTVLFLINNIIEYNVHLTKVINKYTHDIFSLNILIDFMPFTLNF